MAIAIKWAEVSTGKHTRRYTMGTDCSEMGFDPSTGAFLVTKADGTIRSFWNATIEMEHEETPDVITPDNSIVAPDGSKIEP